jgi:hypothetical protein
MDPQEVDGWIAQLGQCKQLSEPDVKRLCEKVSINIIFGSIVTRWGVGLVGGIAGPRVPIAS